uniref:Uncharacterized protein n=2 Tax=Amphimedon queenslandica TaxID=400682 RepID=A0A1X7SXI9_AMPQE
MGDRLGIAGNGVSMEWKLSSQDYTWDGPIIDHWITMLSTLFQPIIGREEFLSFFSSPRPATGGGGGEGVDRQESQPWTFVEEDEGQDSSASDEVHHLMLNESDFISILDQFPITDVFKCLLNAREGQYAISHISSYQMLQFISFCTCLIRLFGRIFSILRHSSYKEFIKQVGRTIRQIVQYVADHWSSYKALKLSAGDTMSCMPSGEDPVLRYSLERLQIEFDQFVLRATQWILTAHK